MGSYKISVLLLAVLVISVRSLPLNTYNSDESSSNQNLSGSRENDEKLVQTNSNEQNVQTDEFASEDNESSINNEHIQIEIDEEEEVDAEAQADVDSIQVDEIESRSAHGDDDDEDDVAVIVKRSPDIPDPDLYQPQEKADRSDAPNEHPTHDEYLEWKSQLPRFRRSADDIDTENTNDDGADDNHNGDDNDHDDEENDGSWDVQPLVENSLEDYAQGCEVMENNSDENNETTYNDYRRKRDANDEESSPEQDHNDSPQSDESEQIANEPQLDENEDEDGDGNQEEVEPIHESEEDETVRVSSNEESEDPVPSSAISESDES